MNDHVDVTSLYKTQWMAYFKKGLGSPAIVYGNSRNEAMKNALAYYRKNQGMMSMWPIDKVVDYVELIG